MKHCYILLLFATAGISLFAQQPGLQPSTYPALGSQAVLMGSVNALRQTPPKTDYKTKSPGKPFEKRNYFFGNEWKNPEAQPQNRDPLLQYNAVTERNGSQSLIPGFNFEGLHDPSGIFPPDPCGAVGKNHFVQMVNSTWDAWFQIWDKHTGASVYGPALTSTIWSQVGIGSQGDPIIQYDHAAERWLMMELAADNDFELLLAISDNSDPTGSWKVYRVQTFGFPDYPKLYVWHNAYFITVNELANGNKCAGYALHRQAMLTGEANIDIYRFQMPNFQGIKFQPATGADWEGGPVPPAGSPGYIFRAYDDAWAGGQDHLESWEVYVDWDNTALNHLVGPFLLFPAPFETRVCHGPAFSWDCIEQPGANSPRIAALENTIVYNAPYRNFGDYESVVFNHVVDVSGVVGDGGDAAVRWYEMRKTAGNPWQIYQQGTYAPDVQTNRFMGTISMDEAGNIGLGYSGVSSSLYPGLYLTARKKDDPLGEMTYEEHTLALGAASHQQVRWGDYSSMTVDPYDGRTFWFTGEYQPNGAVTWGTRIGSFIVFRDTFDIKPESLLAPQSSALLDANEAVSVRIRNHGLAATQGTAVSLYLDGNLIVQDNIAAVIAPGAFFDHTFSQTVDMSLLAQNYTFRCVTHWLEDQFKRNDTLDVVVQKLTANDVALTGVAGLPTYVCGDQSGFGLILRNASGQLMENALVSWRLNNQSWQQYNWTGSLLSGRSDTIYLSANGIINGMNKLEALASLPNGAADEQASNNSLAFDFKGNTNGVYLQVEAATTYGVLDWALYTTDQQLIASGELDKNDTSAQICSDDGQCYYLVLKASSVNWGGKFKMSDIYGHVLADVNLANTEETRLDFCAPNRKQIDFGVVDLSAPNSGPFLSNNEVVSIKARNFGTNELSTAYVAYRVNEGNWVTETIPVPLLPGQTIEHSFSTRAAVGQPGVAYNFDLVASVQADQLPTNDTLQVVVFNRFQRELEIVGIDPGTACSDTNSALVSLYVRNNGVGDVHIFNLAYSINGIPQTTSPGNYLFAGPGETAEVLIFLTGMNSGINTLDFDITDVDGFGPDELPGNDQASIDLSISPDYQLATMSIASDSKPNETTWEIVDGQGAVVYSGGPYAEPLGFQVINLCLKRDSCYLLKLHDSGGDGTNGFVGISLENLLIFEFTGGNFGSDTSILFCSYNACETFELSAIVTPATGAGSGDGQIDAVISGGISPYSFRIDSDTWQASPHFDNLATGGHNLGGLDGLGCEKVIYVYVGSVGTSSPAGPRQLVVTPNPTIGVAHVELAAHGNEKNAVCAVYDTRGKLLQTSPMSRWGDQLQTNIALDRYPPGIYLLYVRGLEKGYVGRVVKK